MDEKVKAPAPRRWWLAAVLSILLPGWGQIYNGQTKKGVFLFFLANIVSIVSLLLILHVPSKTTLALAAILFASVIVFIILDASVTSRRIGRDYVRAGSALSIYALVVCGLILSPVVRTIAKTYIIEAYKIPSSAMKPTLLVGDHILVDKMYPHSRYFERGDVVVFDYPAEPGKIFIKRIVGVPGDVIEIRAKQLYLNGSPVLEKNTVHLDSQIISSADSERDFFGPVRVTPDFYFVLGDNRDQSHDSRFWGFVGRSKIKGKAKAIYWSWDGSENKTRWERLGKEIL